MKHILKLKLGLQSIELPTKTKKCKIEDTAISVFKGFQLVSVFLFSNDHDQVVTNYC